MKELIPVLFLLSQVFCAQVFAQKTSNSKAIPEFKNQGEQEDYWTKQFFQNEYKEQPFKAFSLKVIIKNSAFVFLDDSLFVNNPTEEVKSIFLNGLLYPTLIGGNRISNIEELKFLEKSPQRRRFKFLLYRKDMLNPTICFFELTNMNATQVTNLTEFIRNARLTFFKQGWIMI